MKKLVLLTIVLALISTSAFAAKSSGKAYGAAGCGLGSMAMGKDGNQVLAATTNGTFGTQLFGITSGTSNCTDGGAMASNQQLPVFVEANRLALSNDIARGSGETVANLSEVMGCNDPAHLANTLQSNFKAIFPSATIASESVTQAIVDVVKKDAKLSCKRVG